MLLKVSLQHQVIPEEKAQARPIRMHNRCFIRQARALERRSTSSKHSAQNLPSPTAGFVSGRSCFCFPSRTKMCSGYAVSSASEQALPCDASYSILVQRLAAPRKASKTSFSSGCLSARHAAKDPKAVLATFMQQTATRRDKSAARCASLCSDCTCAD